MWCLAFGQGAGRQTALSDACPGGGVGVRLRTVLNSVTRKPAPTAKLLRSQRTVTSRLWGHTLPPSGEPSGKTSRFQLHPAGLSPRGHPLNENTKAEAGPRSALSSPDEKMGGSPGRPHPLLGDSARGGGRGPRAQLTPAACAAGPASGERLVHFKTVGKMSGGE